MFLRKKLGFLLITFLTILISSNSLFATCKTTPDLVQVKTGTLSLGNISLGERIYVKPDLSQNPLELVFYFENNENDCYESDDFQFKLFPSGSPLNPNSVESANKTTKVKFLVQLNTQITNTILPVFIANNKNNEGPQVSQMIISIDNDGPLFTPNVLIEPSTTVEPNKKIVINYYVNDEKSGIRNLQIIRGSDSENLELKGAKTYTGEISEELSNSKTYSLVATDMLGNTNEKFINITVDDNDPRIDNLVKIYQYDGTRQISFRVDISDNSFTNDFFADPMIIGNFSDINPDAINVPGSCSQKLDEDTYICYFSPIDIKLDETTNANIDITANDFYNNEISRTFREEIFVDKTAPEILEFYVENSLGIRNIINAQDNNTKVVLRFKDESLNKGDTRIIEDFGLIELPPSFTCNQSLSSNIAYCTWNLNNLLEIYLPYETKEETYRIVNIVDFYSNSNNAQVDVLVDNKAPEITNIELIEFLNEGEGINDGVIQSGDNINYRVTINDENLYSGEYFVYADFSQIDFRDGQNQVQGNCYEINVTTTNCDFNDIKVENGYMKKNITFLAMDIAGNRDIKTQEVEVFSISNETFSSYRIAQINGIPINRNIIERTSVKSWFEGEIEKVSTGDNTKIVNYQLRPGSCDISNLDPLLIIPGSLMMFPEDVVIPDEDENQNSPFAMKLELSSHDYISDLNVKTITCEMAILKRDDTQVFPPEIVEFKLNVQFFDIPRGNIIDAYADQILELYVEVEWLEKWFGTLEDIYEPLKDICSMYNQVTSAITTASQIINNIKLLFDGATNAVCAGQSIFSGGATYAACKEALQGPTANAQAGAHEASSNMIDKLTSQDSVIKKACDWVSCSNGRTLGGLLTGTTGEGNDATLSKYPGVGALIKVKNALSVGMCTGDFSNIPTPKFGSKGEAESTTSSIPEEFLPSDEGSDGSPEGGY